MTLEKAKAALDRIIKISRVHLYKPIQIAEILHRDRVNQDIDLSNINTYRNTSKVWRNLITALRGSFGVNIGNRVLLTLKEQIIAEFPASDNQDFTEFYEGRNYNLLTDDIWV
jgi:hypothetical protein